MAKSRRRREREARTYKIITLGCSITCIALNLFVVCFHYFHPFVELLENRILLWCAIIPSFVIIGALIFLTYVIYRGRQEAMKRVFIALCIVLFLEIFVAFSTIILYVMVIDHRLSNYEKLEKLSEARESDAQQDSNTRQELKVQSAAMMKIQKKLKCELKNSRLTLNSETKEPPCIPAIKTQTRTTAVYVATIYMIKFVLLGSEALMILFYYMNYLPT